MDFVAFTLAGTLYRLRFVPDDLEDICTRLTPLQTPGSPPVSPASFGQMIVNNQPSAINFALLHGLRHSPEYKRIDMPDVRRIVRQAIDGGAQYNDFRRPIVKAMIRCGLAEFQPILKILEDTEAQAAAEAHADEARIAGMEINPETREITPGNGSRPSSVSPTTSLTTASSDSVS